MLGVVVAILLARAGLSHGLAHEKMASTELWVTKLLLDSVLLYGDQIKGGKLVSRSIQLLFIDSTFSRSVRCALDAGLHASSSPPA
jgi:hypothetical protein